jgi:uncharacterized membrane protein
MKPLVVLLGTFGASLLVTMFATGNANYRLSGQIAMAVMLAFTAIGHFVFVEGMMKMVPDLFPFKKQIVYVTGVIEIAAAIGLLIPQLRYLTAWLLILFFVLILPANINAAVKEIDFQKGSDDGPGLSYLWFRIPLQVFFIGWVYYFAVLGP